MIKIRDKNTNVFEEPFLEEGKNGSRKFRHEAEIFGIFSIEVAPISNCYSLIYSSLAGPLPQP